MERAARNHQACRNFGGARQRARGSLPRREHAQAVRRRAIQASRQSDGAGRLLFGPRLDVPLVLHAPERHVHSAALEAALRLLDELQAEHFLAGEQIEDQALGAGQLRNVHLMQLLSILHFVSQGIFDVLTHESRRRRVLSLQSHSLRHRVFAVRHGTRYVVTPVWPTSAASQSWAGGRA